MDFSSPVEAVIPGVQGRVLGVLARADTELTMRSVAQLGGVSVNRAVVVLNDLIRLGLVQRREVGPAALVHLDRENEAARAVLALQEVSTKVVRRLRSSAGSIQPAPASLVLFGSFVRGQASADSDLDVLAVRSRDVGVDDPGWDESLGQWSDQATRIAGSPVNLVVVGEDELSALLRRRRSVWGEIAREGTVIMGAPLDELVVA
ncbi:MAG: nucleotidyltransferase domain-containing protein [Acidimicrobiales bacterium]